MADVIQLFPRRDRSAPAAERWPTPESMLAPMEEALALDQFAMEPFRLDETDFGFDDEADPDLGPHDTQPVGPPEPVAAELPSLSNVLYMPKGARRHSALELPTDAGGLSDLLGKAVEALDEAERVGTFRRIKAVRG